MVVLCSTVTEYLLLCQPLHLVFSDVSVSKSMVLVATSLNFALFVVEYAIEILFACVNLYESCD